MFPFYPEALLVTFLPVVTKTGVASVPEEGAIKLNGKRLAVVNLSFYRCCLEGFCCTETEAGEGEDCDNLAVLGSTGRIPLAQQLRRLPFAAGQVAAVSAVRKNYQAGNRNGRIQR